MRLFILFKKENTISSCLIQNKIAMNLNLNELLSALLARCLKPFMQMRKKLSALLLTMFLLNSFVFAQQSTVTGKVTDEKSNPLIGASVKISNSNTGVTTDAN